MDTYLYTNDDGTSTGFIVTKKRILMFYRDDMINFPNTVSGKQKIGSFLKELEALREIEE